MEFPTKLRELAKKHDMTLEQLAEIGGVSRSTAARWLAGSTSPRVSEVQLLADHFGVSLSEMLGVEREKLTTEQTVVLGFLETIGFEELQRRLLK